MNHENPEKTAINDMWLDSVNGIDKYSSPSQDTLFISSLPSPRILFAHAPATFYNPQLDKSSLKVGGSS